MNTFWTISALLTAAALLFILSPLLARRERAMATRREANLAIYRDQLHELDADLAAGTLSPDDYAKARRELEARLLEEVVDETTAGAPARRRSGAALAVSVALPLLAFALYFAVGTPQAILPSPATSEAAAHGVTPQQLEALIEQLAARMREDPADPEGWILLARSYRVLGRFADAARAYASATALRPRDAELLADYADMLAMAQGGGMLGEPETIVARALEADPGNLKALALAGGAAFEKKDYAGAIRYWERMLALLAPDSDGARSIEARITEARALAGALRLEPPRSLGDLELAHALRGEQALREIDRLHGKRLGAQDGYVAHYEKEGAAAMLYLARASSPAQADRQLEQMSDRIRRGDTPFNDLATSRRGAIALYSASGQGQLHYFFRRGSNVLWLAVDAPVAKQTLAALDKALK